MKPAPDANECLVHVCICTNERPAPRVGCKDFGGQQFYQLIKDRLKQTGKVATHWATRTGCLGYCNTVGTTVVIHRRGEAPEWLTDVTAADLDSVWEKIVRE
jgi:(2Fe-2S) ferredoxin